MAKEIQKVVATIVKKQDDNLIKKVVDDKLSALFNQNNSRMFSNRQAIQAVSRAIEVELDSSTTSEQKKAAALLAVGVAKNSMTASEEISALIDRIGNNIL